MKSVVAIGLSMLVVLAAIAITGITSAGAVEPAAHFLACRPKSGGKWQFGCLKEGPPFEMEKTYVGAVPEAIKTAGLSAFELEATVLGKTVVVACTSEAGTSSVRNPEPFNSTNGEGESSILAFEGCVVEKMASCAIAGKKITTNKLHETAEAVKTPGLGVKFAPTSGTTFAKIVLNEECVLGTEIVVQGSDFGLVGEKGAFEFTNASSSLTVGGKEAKLRGRFEAKEEKGNLVTVD